MVSAASMLVVSVVATAFALRISTRSAPWRLKDLCEPPTVRRYFVYPAADPETTPARIVPALVLPAVLMAMLLALTKR